MKIVFDTNVLIAAFIATGTCKDIFEYAVENYEVVLSPYILNELKDKLITKLGFSLDDFKEINDLLHRHVFIIREKKVKLQFSDKKDIPILNLCLSVNADLLITGDKQIRKLNQIGSTVIITPSEFWEFEKSVQIFTHPMCEFTLSQDENFSF